MFLYAAVLAALVGSVDATGLDNVRHIPAVMDVQKYIQYAKEHPSEATAPHSRNLRDMVKPDDMVFDMYRDPACTIPTVSSVRHGNTCYQSDNTNPDGTPAPISRIKLGCMVDARNHIALSHYDYGQSPDCAGEPLSMMTIPMLETPASPGECVNMGDGYYARLSCTNKDPFRDAFGYHVLNFEQGQTKECHDHSIKTNRPMIHTFIAANKCVSMDSGMSIMPLSCAPGKVQYRQDPHSENCANLGPVHTGSLSNGCKQVDDDYNTGSSGTSVSKEFCVDETTGPQQ